MLNKVALISDIQGNLFALEKVLDAIKKEGDVEKIVCLGDVASGPYPHQVLTLLRTPDIQIVKGNMDDEILNPRHHETDNLETQYFDDIDLWCSQQLTDDDKAFIRSFTPSITLELAGKIRLMCFHGSPYSYNAVIDETISDDDLATLLDGYEESIMATGHMHHPFLRRFRHSWVLNPGSVGLPRKQSGKYPLHAHYVILAIHEDRPNIEFRQLAIDGDELAKGIRNSGMPHAEWFLSQWDITS